VNWPDLPNHHALAVLLLTIFALYLFRRDDIPLQTSSLAVLSILPLGFSIFPFIRDGVELAPQTFFSGFGHEALVTVCSLMILGQGLVRTGALEPIGRVLARLWNNHPMLSLLLTLIVAASLSAFVNNTPIVILLLPILISVAVRTGKSSSRMLLPMGLATLVGGMATTIGTSTNLLVVAVAHDLGVARFGIFDFAAPAVAAGTVALVYLWLLAPRMLPENTAAMSDIKPRLFDAGLNISQQSPSADCTLSELIRKTDGLMQVSAVRRGGDKNLVPLPDTRVLVGDRLLVRDTPERLKEFEQVLGATLYNVSDGEHPVSDLRNELC